MVGDVPPPHTPNIFSSILDDLQKRLCEEVGGLFPPVPLHGDARDFRHVSAAKNLQNLFIVTFHVEHFSNYFV